MATDIRESNIQSFQVRDLWYYEKASMDLLSMNTSIPELTVKNFLFSLNQVNEPRLFGLY